MRFITATDRVDFSSDGFIVESYYFDGGPAKRSTKVPVIGAKKEIVFTDEYKNRRLRVRFVNVSDKRRAYRQNKMHEIISKLQKEGFIILDQEPGWMYKGRVTESSPVEYTKFYDYLTVTFDLDPLAYNVAQGDEDTWENTELTWEHAYKLWEGDSTFTTTSGTLAVTNFGNHPALPLIKITTETTADVSLSVGGETLTADVDGSITIDCERMIAYDESKSNKMTSVGGDFIELAPGDNEVVVSTNREITLEFKHKDRWV